MDLFIFIIFSIVLYAFIYIQDKRDRKSAKSQFDTPSTEVTFDLGRIEGQKELLNELEEIIDLNDPKYLVTYVKARQRTMNTKTQLTKRFRNEAKE